MGWWYFVSPLFSRADVDKASLVHSLDVFRGGWFGSADVLRAGAKGKDVMALRQRHPYTHEIRGDHRLSVVTRAQLRKS
jgi:hypothetical protein